MAASYTPEPRIINREYKQLNISPNTFRVRLEFRLSSSYGSSRYFGRCTPGPVVALRADMDAFRDRTYPMPFKSTAIGEYQGNEVGVMHACGHDTHVAILMGVAQIPPSSK